MKVKQSIWIALFLIAHSFIQFFNFIPEFEMPDTFASWFVVMELHIYILAARLFKQEVVGIHARDMLTDSFWDDVQFRSTRLGVSAP